MSLTAGGFTSQDTFTPDRLFAGDMPRETVKVTLNAGTLTRGTVLGRITVGGAYLQSLSAAVDGSEVPDAILAEDADASGSAVDALVYRAGEFNEDALTIGAAHTADSIRQGLRERGIFLKKTQPAAA